MATELELGANLVILAFFIASTLFLYWGHAKKILLLELFAMIMTVIGGAWALGQIWWGIPVLFMTANVIVFALDVAR